MNTLVIDTNILMSALIKEGLTREILTNLQTNFIFPDFGLEEIYRHKEEIKYKAKLNEKDFNIILLRVLKHINLIPINLILPFSKESKNIIKNIDEDDSVFIATALTFNCPIWSEDKHFKKQNKVKVFTTSELKEFID